jgi:uncharacterized damage-inducible protein DinB
MDANKLFLITDLDGFTPQISRLLSMMNYARHTTVQSVRNLSVEQLDYLHDQECNSIGALLHHIAAVEYGYQVRTFENRQLNDTETAKWEPALELGELGQKHIKGYNLKYYITLLDEVRQKTIEEFRNRNDEWLAMETPFWGGEQANNYFKWFHVFEDEINHRGQIRWIRKRLPRSDR